MWNVRLENEEVCRLASEIFAHRDVTVADAFRLASEFLEARAARTGTEVTQAELRWQAIQRRAGND